MPGGRGGVDVGFFAHSLAVGRVALLEDAAAVALAFLGAVAPGDDPAAIIEGGNALLVLRTIRGRVDADLAARITLNAMEAAET